MGHVVSKICDTKITDPIVLLLTDLRVANLGFSVGFFRLVSEGYASISIQRNGLPQDLRGSLSASLDIVSLFDLKQCGWPRAQEGQVTTPRQETKKRRLYFHKLRARQRFFQGKNISSIFLTCSTTSAQEVQAFDHRAHAPENRGGNNLELFFEAQKQFGMVLGIGAGRPEFCVPINYRPMPC